MSDFVVIKGIEQTISDCETVIVVPEIAATEAGYIKTFSRKEVGNAKHEFHALAQMVYFRLQDGDMEITAIDSPVTICYASDCTELQGGLILYLNQNGDMGVLAQCGQNHKKLIEAAYRYCTRWVRLDI
ncbi:MAG: hypothetical protein OEL83_18435 [Desulforhopalus sp.]|nr:hypothetical protein [Desulforhopalus sp.]